MPGTPRPRPDLAGLLILVLPPLFWAGNFVVGRAVRGDVPPMTLSFGRWLIAFACLLPFAWRPLRRDLPRYWQHRWRLLGLAVVGVAAFNSLVYAGLRSTTATNGLLLNSFIPLLIVLFGALFYRQRLGARQYLGLALSFAGVLTIVLHGDWTRLAALQFSHGDLVVFAAMVCWALYTLWLRGMPADIDRVGLMEAQIGVAVVCLLPLFLWEYASGQRAQWNAPALAAFAYVGIFPSVLAYLLYNLGVARVGPARAGLFIHLMPVFGALLSVLFLHEPLHAYHAAGFCLILAGLACSGGATRPAAATDGHPPPSRPG